MSTFIEKMNLADNIQKIEPIEQNLYQVDQHIKTVDEFAVKVRDDFYRQLCDDKEAADDRFNLAEADIKGHAKKLRELPIMNLEIENLRGAKASNDDLLMFEERCGNLYLTIQAFEMEKNMTTG